MTHIDDVKALLEENAKLSEQLLRSQRVCCQEFDKCLDHCVPKERHWKERAEAAEARVKFVEDSFVECEEQLTIANAKLKALSEQKPIGFVAPSVIDALRGGTRWGGARITPRIDEDDGTTAAIYAQPIPPASEQEPCICLTNIFDNDPETGEKKHCHDCGGTGVADLQNEVERYKRLYAHECGIRSKRGEMLLERDKRIAELERKLSAYQSVAIMDEDYEELNSLLAQARDEGRKDAVPDVDWLANIIRSVDGTNNLGAGMLAEKLVEAMLASAPKPEAKP